VLVRDGRESLTAIRDVIYHPAPRTPRVLLRSSSERRRALMAGSLPPRRADRLCARGPHDACWIL